MAVAFMRISSGTKKCVDTLRLVLCAFGQRREQPLCLAELQWQLDCVPVRSMLAAPPLQEAGGVLLHYCCDLADDGVLGCRDVDMEEAGCNKGLI
jgi:hypothetical protein